MKKLLFLCLLLTAFYCKPAAFEKEKSHQDDDEQITIKASNGDEFQISKEIGLEFSQTIEGVYEVNKGLNQGAPISFESDIVQPETLKLMLPILEQAHNILIEKPTSWKGSYIELSEKVKELSKEKISPSSMYGVNKRCAIDGLIKLMALADFLAIDERVKQAIALIVFRTHLYKKYPAEVDSVYKYITKLISTELISTDVSQILPYITQQHYLMGNRKHPKIVTKYVEEIGVAVRDLVIHEQSSSKISAYFEKSMQRGGVGELDVSRRYIRDLDGIGDIPSIDQAKRLFLYSNQIQSIADLNLPFPRLYLLDLSDNQIDNFSPQILQNFPELKVLYLQKNPITQERVNALREAAAKTHPNLKINS